MCTFKFKDLLQHDQFNSIIWLFQTIVHRVGHLAMVAQTSQGWTRGSEQYVLKSDLRV